MGYCWDKQPASRVIKTQTLAHTGSCTVVSPKLTPHTYQFAAPIFFGLAGGLPALGFLTL
jgi:hypothetical protein